MSHLGSADLIGMKQHRTDGETDPILGVTAAASERASDLDDPFRENALLCEFWNSSLIKLEDTSLLVTQNQLS